MPKLSGRLRITALVLTAAIVLVAISSLTGSADVDGDGVPDEVDRCSRTPPGQSVDAEGCSAAEQAFSAGVRTLLADTSTLAAGEAWLLKELSQVRPDPDLERFVEAARKKLSHDKAARLLDPNAAKTPLPVSPGQGIIKLMYYVLAPIGQPETRAIQFMEDFLSEPGTEYVLTHQFLVIEWARTVGLDLPESLRMKTDDLLERIAREQAADAEFSDLYAERAALLLAFADVPRATADAWVEKILAAQTVEGRWQDNQRRRLTYDGQSSLTVHPWAHTSGFAVAALGFYLHRCAALH